MKNFYEAGDVLCILSTYVFEYSVLLVVDSLFSMHSSDYYSDIKMIPY